MPTAMFSACSVSNHGAGGETNCFPRWGILDRNQQEQAQAGEAGLVFQPGGDPRKNIPWRDCQIYVVPLEFGAITEGSSSAKMQTRTDRANTLLRKQTRNMNFNNQNGYLFP